MGGDGAVSLQCMKINFPRSVFRAFPENSVMRLSHNKKRLNTVKALKNLNTRKLLSSQTSARQRMVVLMCAMAFGISVTAGAVRAEPGQHARLIEPSTVYATQDSEFSAEIPTVEIADLGGDESGEYFVHVQLAQLAEDANDPLEGMNRAIFGFNEFIYSGLLGPVADVYNILPSEARTIVSSFLSNLSEPIVFVNDLLQGEVERAMNTFTRFAMNTTFGFGGLADVATAAGVESHNEDFGQTLAVWGVDEGFYLVLPLLGPSNPRDAIGQYLVDSMIDPVNIYLDNKGEDDFLTPRAAAAGFTDFASVRDDLVALKKNSIDYYAAIRSLYRQKRQAEIANGSEADLPAIPDFEFSDFPAFDEPEPALGDTKSPDLDTDGAGVSHE